MTIIIIFSLSLPPSLSLAPSLPPSLSLSLLSLSPLSLSLPPSLLLLSPLILRELPTSEIQRKKSDIRQWLKGLSDRGEVMKRNNSIINLQIVFPYKIYCTKNLYYVECKLHECTRIRLYMYNVLLLMCFL